MRWTSLGANTEKILLAYMDVFGEFERLYIVEHPEDGDVRPSTLALFDIAMKDSFLGELLREEIANRYRELREQEEQIQQEEVEAHA